MSAFSFRLRFYNYFVNLQSESELNFGAGRAYWCVLLPLDRCVCNHFARLNQRTKLNVWNYRASIANRVSVYWFDFEQMFKTSKFQLIKNNGNVEVHTVLSFYFSVIAVDLDSNWRILTHPTPKFYNLKIELKLTKF